MVKKLLRNVIGLFKHRTIVLMYHRIASPETDPWQLAVTIQNFEAQLQVMKRHYQVIPLNELLDERIGEKTSPIKICITFDDAYVDNYLHAKPLLEKHHCPATFFIPTAYIGHTQPFWWDKLESIVLHSIHLPPSIHIFIQSQVFEFESVETFLSDEVKQKHKNWNWLVPPPTKRCEFYLALWERLQPLPCNEIVTVLEEVSHWAGYKQLPDISNLPMNIVQLNEICLQPMFDIGVHTSTHPALAFHSIDIQRTEIANCREYLEKLSGRQMNSMAYPYGNYNEETLSIVKDQGFSTAFTTQPQLLTKSADPHLIGRFQVINQDGNCFKKQLRLWTRDI